MHDLKKNDYLKKVQFEISEDITHIFRTVAIVAMFLILLMLHIGGDSLFSKVKLVLYIYFVYSVVLLLFKNPRKKLAFRLPLLLPVIDVSLLTIGIILSGGETSPYFVFYAVFIAFVASAYGLKGSAVLGGISAVFYAAAIILANGSISGHGIIKFFFLALFSAFTGVLEEKIHRNAYSMAVHDSLTSLYNYQYFYGSLEHILQESAKVSRPVSLAVIDVDDFKLFNDKHGHLEGDRILSVIASIIKPYIRADDLAARYGGDELVVIFPNTGNFAALKICERIKDNIVSGLKEAFEDDITISVGIAAFPENGKTPFELFDSADKALYKAKKAGKNNIMLV